MLALAERLARPKAERFDRPLRDGRVFLHHFPALRTGLLSLHPSGMNSAELISAIPIVLRCMAQTRRRLYESAAQRDSGAEVFALPPNSTTRSLRSCYSAIMLLFSLVIGPRCL